MEPHVGLSVWVCHMFFLTRAVVFDEISPYKGLCWDLRLRGGGTHQRL